MRPPLSYYGGKQQLAKKIVSLIPEHKIYCEPFCGGAAVLFAKEPSQFEVINDTNAEIINFYQVVQEDFPALQKEIMKTLHSREMYRHARVIYENPDMFDTVKRAWAVWVQANMSFGNGIGKGFAYGRKSGITKNIVNKINTFTNEIANRIRMLQIENCDALKVIASRDTADTFHYIDPPYVGTNQGHYDGYTQQDFDNLLETLQNIKGKFLISSYRNKALMEFTKKNNWYCIELKMASSLSAKGKAKRMTKIEVLTANYPISLDKGQEAKKEDSSIGQSELIFEKELSEERA
ncbi:DNA adenine methylase [Treponema phagedenis]|uniref:DNA adenine methylase n=1 Tax=Treponema phagedenis TaxID=162 RepID=UPI0011EC7528|nr:DNA adenine methylase [Treponema phagedenis]TYT78071.1 DNA adenine methylase [Treponema phagedenis]